MIKLLLVRRSTYNEGSAWSETVQNTSTTYPVSIDTSFSAGDEAWREYSQDALDRLNTLGGTRLTRIIVARLMTTFSCRVGPGAGLLERG